MSVTTKTTSAKKVSRPGVSQTYPCAKRDPSSSKNPYSPPSPPNPICDTLNKQIRNNSVYSYPTFDFASYVQRRSYTLSTIDFGRSIGASFLDDGVHDIIAGLLSQLPPSAPPASPSYEIHDAREKGKGIFATSFIPSGKAIFDEHPTIIAPYFLGISVPIAEMLTELFETLPKSAFGPATCLVTSRQDDVAPPSPSSLPPPSFYEDIMQTNSVAINLMVPTNTSHPEIPTHRGLFLLLSRCNHSCNPNATWSWDASSLTLTLTASRPISPGEEVTISYIPLSADHAADRMTLKEAYGFDCTCEECTLPSYTAANSNVVPYSVSDPGKSDIEGITDIGNLPTFDKWLSDLTLPDTLLIDAHKNALCSIEKQRQQKLSLSMGPSLESLPESPTFTSAAKEIDGHVEMICMCYGALGDVYNFRKWATIVKEGAVSPKKERVVSNWLSNPRSFPLWDKRPT